MENTTSRFRGMASALHIGSHSLPAIMVLSATTALVCATVMPFLFFVFGKGWLPPMLLLVAVFGVVLLSRRLLFARIYHKVEGEGDAALLEFFVQQNAMGPQEEEVSVELLENALQLKQVRVNDCMTPRPEIVHVDVSGSIDELRKQFIGSRLSRILITDGELDQVLGYAHVQQMFGKPVNIRRLVMPIAFVPETMPVDEMLQRFIKSRRSIACVVDEYGSIAGVITLEDALEQLFGEIDDEHDQEEFIEVAVGEQEYLFSGRLRIDYLNEHYPNLQLVEGDYHTLSGYLLAGAQTIPEQGVQVELNGKTFIFELVSERKIETVRILW